MNARIEKTSGETGLYNNSFDIAGQVLIEARIKQGVEYITLESLYETLAADTKDKQTSILWAVQRAKDRGDIKKTSRRAIYEVVR